MQPHIEYALTPFPVNTRSGNEIAVKSFSYLLEFKTSTRDGIALVDLAIVTKHHKSLAPARRHRLR